jgi:RNA polymerase sigma-70 factor, ECF subfamily
LDVEKADFSDPAISDSLLMSWIAVGELAAVAPLIARYERPLFALMLRTLRDPAVAEDLLQETWIRVVRSAKSYDPSLPFNPWLFRIAWNLLRDAISRRETRAAREMPIDHATAIAHDATACRTAEERQQSEQLRATIAALPPRLAEAVVLKYFDELTEREVASRLGVPIGTVKSRLHHALRKLAVALEETR